MNKKVYFITGLVFLVCFYVGLLLAEHKSLWNDEIFTQINSVDRLYKSQLLGQIGEGNNAPLFYSIQKGICDLFHYQTPDLWHNQTSYDRLILRFNPVLFMSLSIACIFFYFSRFYSLFAGAYSLFLSLSSFIIWAYWAEARPYSLWIFLTTVQSLYFLYIFRHKIRRRTWIGLTITHFLLSFTAVFGAFQIFIVSGLLWIFKEKRLEKYILLTLIPICITIFYYTQTHKFNFYFDLTPEQLLRDCFSRDRLYILLIFGFFLMTPNKVISEGIPYFLLTLLMILAFIFIIVIFKIKSNPNIDGFPVSSRYFVYLTPISIISTTLLSTIIFRSLETNRLIQLFVLSGMGYLVIHRFIKIIF